MRANQKFTPLVAFHSITGASQRDDVLTATPDDGSVLTIKTAPANKNEAATVAKIVKCSSSRAPTWR